MFPSRASRDRVPWNKDRKPISSHLESFQSQHYQLLSIWNGWILLPHGPSVSICKTPEAAHPALDSSAGVVGRSSRRLTYKLSPGNQRLLIPSQSLEYMLCPLFPWWEWFQGQSLKRISCCWHHLDGTCDWTLLRPLYKLLRLWQMGGETSSSSSCPWQTLYINSLFLFKPPPTYLEWLGPFLVSPCLLSMRPISKLTWSSVLPEAVLNSVSPMALSPSSWFSQLASQTKSALFPHDSHQEAWQFPFQSFSPSSVAYSLR